MALTAQDRTFLDFAERWGDLIHGCALLLEGSVPRAERLAQSVLARRHPIDGPEEALLGALRELIRPRPGFFRPPWAAEPRLQLVDAGVAQPPTPLLAELRRLPTDQRACVVLAHYATLPPPAVAAVLGVTSSAVEPLTQQAVATLAAARPERLQAGRLAEELRQVMGLFGQAGSGRSPAADLQHARQLRRRRRSRHVAALGTAVLLLVAGAVGIFRGQDPVAQADRPTLPVLAPTPSSTRASAPPVRAACATQDPPCLASIVRAWRAEMSRVAMSHLDPAGTYFTGYSFSYNERYETPSLWRGQGGALGLEIFRLPGGATEVYLQVASDEEFAVSCGALTQQACRSARLADGNQINHTGSDDASRGIEVQQSPDGGRVVTLVARNLNAGEVLPVTNGDLMALARDPRLRLPEI